MGVFVYVSVVVWIMQNAERLFADQESFWIPVAMLLLFVLSAAITGLLVFGRPAYLFLSSQKFEALRLLFFTISWLVVIVIIVLAFQLG